MASYNNVNNSSFYYSIPSGSVEFDSYPFLGQMSATEEANKQTTSTVDGRWNTIGWHEPMVGSSSSLQATASYESVASTTSDETQAIYGHRSYPHYHWPAASQWPQFPQSGFLSRDGSFATSMASETPTVIPTPSSVPLDYWGASQSGQSTDAFYHENAFTSHWSNVGPTRTGPMRTGRFQPYGTYHPNEYGNAEAGPSSLVAQPIPHLGLPTPQPSGGISETAADAATKQTKTEELEVTVSKRTRLPRGQGPPRRSRVGKQGTAHKLCDWVRRQEGLPRIPSLNVALAVAVEIIRRFRWLENPEPCLHTMPTGEPTEGGTKSARQERERRSVERELFQELSRWYPLGPGRNKWTTPALLLKVLKDLEDPLAPLELFNNPPP